MKSEIIYLLHKIVREITTNNENNCALNCLKHGSYKQKSKILTNLLQFIVHISVSDSKNQ